MVVDGAVREGTVVVYSGAVSWVEECGAGKDVTVSAWSEFWGKVAGLEVAGQGISTALE